jgi:Leucine-rich repeat (LRR) protein
MWNCSVPLQEKAHAQQFLHLTAADIPVKDLYGSSLGNYLHKLSLAGNRLSTVPPKSVTCLAALKTLGLSQCELHQLPEEWNLPQLKRLNLSYNQLTEFPEGVSDYKMTKII